MIVLDNAMDSGVDSCPTLPIDTRKRVSPGAVGTPDLARIIRNSVDFRTGEIWHTAQVTGRQEITFSEKMKKAGYRAYTPMERVTSYVKRREKGRDGEARKLEYDRAMWSKYSFFAGGYDAIYAAKSTNFLQMIVPDVHQRKLVNQLETLAKQLMQDDHQIVTDEIESGAWYRLIWPHAFAGYIGIAAVVDDRVTLEIDIFGDKRPIEITKPELLERIKG